MSKRGVELKDPRAGDAGRGEPDIVCVDALGTPVGIEVAADHYTGEAENLWAHLRGTPEKSSRWIRPGEDLRTTLG